MNGQQSEDVAAGAPQPEPLPSPEARWARIARAALVQVLGRDVYDAIVSKNWTLIGVVSPVLGLISDLMQVAGPVALYATIVSAIILILTLAAIVGRSRYGGHCALPCVLGLAGLVTFGTVTALQMLGDAEKNGMLAKNIKLIEDFQVAISSKLGLIDVKIDTVSKQINSVESKIDVILDRPIVKFGTRQDVEAAIRLSDVGALLALELNIDNIQLIESTLRLKDNARLFFIGSRDRGDRGWLKRVIAAGLNPNLLVMPGEPDEHQLLKAAFEAENLIAIRTLLEAGASPHVYARLWGRPTSTPPLLFPLVLVNGLSIPDAQKTELVRLMVANGLVLPGNRPPQDAAPSQITYHDNVLANLKNDTGIDPPTVSSICERRAQQLCARYVSHHQGIDWCKVAAVVPHAFRNVRTGGSTQYNYDHLQLVGLVNIVNERLYFLASMMAWPDPGFGILEFNSSLNAMNLYKFTGNSAGMGHCEEILDIDHGRPRKGSYQSTNSSRCWRKVRFSKSRETGRWSGDLAGQYDIESCRN